MARSVRRRVGRFWVTVRVDERDVEKARAILDDLKYRAVWDWVLHNDEAVLRSELEARLAQANVNYESIKITRSKAS